MTKVQITPEESHKVELLYNQFTGYCNILGYLAQYGSINTNLFDKKWEEAVEINRELEALKAELDMKYHPQDGVEYKNYSFDFIQYLMVYVE